MPHRRGAAPLHLAALVAALFFLFAAAALLHSSLVLGETTSNGAASQMPSAAASASAGSGGGNGGGGGLASSFFAPPWASAAASVSSVTARAACSLFSREASSAARDSNRLGLAAAAACDLATNLELWLEPLLSGGGGGGNGGGKPFLPAGAKKKTFFAALLSPSSSSPRSDALAADRAAVAATAAAAASTTSGGGASNSAATASATANARPVCSAATLFPGGGAGGEEKSSSSSSSSTPPRLLLPVCSAPSFELVADGGRCAVESRPPHAVVCVGPSVVLEVSPPACRLGSFSSDENGDENGEFLSSSSSRSLVVDSHCGPPASIATGGQRVFLGGKRLPAFSLNGSGSNDEAFGGGALASFDRAAAALSDWPSGWGGNPLADAKSLAELLAVSLLPGRVTATASVVEE